VSARRVLMTADAVGGVWEYALELCRGLAEAGTEVVLAVMGPPPDEPQRAVVAGLPGVELVAEPYLLEWMDNPWRDVAAAGRWLLELERRRGCDLVHLNGYAHGALPFASPTLVVGHSCVLSWWRAVKGEPAPATWDRYRRAVAAGLARADRVVAPTAWMLGALATHYGPLRRGEVIFNGRRAAGYPLARKEPFVLGAGRVWDEGKNLALLAAAAPRLPWPVRIAGTASGAAGEPFLGKLPAHELAALMARAGIFVSPARYEPFGLTVLEAALSGCALVLSDIPPFRELWQDAAVFVPAGDGAALVAALHRLIARPAVTARLGAQARRRALPLSAARMVREYQRLYEAMGAAPTVRNASAEVQPFAS
jgi:glycogen(starch) synthase